MIFNQPARIIIAVLLCLLIDVSQMSNVALEHLVSPYTYFYINAGICLNYPLPVYIG